MLWYLRPLEADFQRYYSLDIRSVFFGPRALGTRRVVALIEGLPPDSAFSFAFAAARERTEQASKVKDRMRQMFGPGQIKYAP